MNVLAISAHPDDETLGCGGTLMKHRDAGASLHWMIVTRPDGPSWSKEVVERKECEIQTVAEAYGMEEPVRLGFPAARLDTVPMADLIDAIRSGISSIRPELVYTVYEGDVHTDHRIVSSAVMSVLKPFHMADLGVRRIVSFETLSSTEAASPNHGGGFVPTLFNDITAYLDRKIEIMSLYQTEAHQSAMPRSGDSIRALARFRGATVAVPYAEAFMLRRELM